MKLRPHRLVESLLSQTPDGMSLLGRMHLLLVRLDEPDGRLFQTLDATTSAADPLTLDPPTGMTMMRRKSAPAMRVPPPLTPGSLADELRRRVYFAVVLMKRESMATDPRVHLGRSRKNDIVLYDESVSSLQAHLDTDEEGTWSVEDVRSTNGTQLNGQRLSPEAPIDVYSGDRLTFGKVETLLCDARTLRLALEHLSR